MSFMDPRVAGYDRRMALQKLTSTDAFVVTDIPDAPATGVVRMGKKILQSSAKDLARSATYSFAAFGLQRGGASAGINAIEEAIPDAIANFVAEAGDIGGLDLSPGKGVSIDQLGQLLESQHTLAGSRALTVTGVVAAAKWAAGGNLAGKSAVVEGQGSNPMADLVAAGMSDAGADVLTPLPDAKPWMVWGSEVDLLLTGTKPGTLNHKGAESVKASAVIPWGPIPVTTKAYLTLERAGITVLPDFVAASGGLVAPYFESASTDAAELGVEAAKRISTVLDDCAQHGDGVLMGACVRAETFLESWTDWSPFGRPLAA